MANYNSPSVFKNLKGKIFGYLTVIKRTYSFSEKSTYAYWLCKCKCGNKVIRTSNTLVMGNTKSCGCLKIEKIKHTGFLNRNMSGVTPFNILYQRYKNNAKSRRLIFRLTKSEFKKLINRPCFYCQQPPSKIIHNYKRPKDFIKYNGIDRKNNTVGYIKNNCVTCCIFCNRAKYNCTLKEFTTWLKNIRENTHESVNS